MQLFSITIREALNVPYWKMKDTRCICDLTLIYICGYLNDWNSTLQGKCQFVCTIMWNCHSSIHNFWLLAVFTSEVPENISSMKWTVVNVSDTLLSFTDRFLDVDQKNFGMLLKHRMKMLNTHYSLNQLTYIVVNSKKAICIPLVLSWRHIWICGIRQLFVQACLEPNFFTSFPINEAK